ncbi:MAG: hypothetical protein AUK44_05915 [Porphyromonadaceae bacterium CG2_30_38_12]|nr:MAG: hypothetical protein AUK44_05915 [Porphyromonadaceae bacterium CG2_30_38_12]
MNKLKLYLLFLWVTILVPKVIAQSKGNEFVPHGGARLMAQVDGNDTVLLAFLHDIWVFPRNNFKNKRQEQYFWRTVRDVKRTLPYARLIASELRQLNIKISNIKSEQEKKKIVKEFEKSAFSKYENDMKKMTINQGRILIKLVDRETEKTTYDLIKSYKGGFTAFFWQGIATIFGSSLKSEFDANNKDKVLDRVIVLVEAGQL